MYGEKTYPAIGAGELAALIRHVKVCAAGYVFSPYDAKVPDVAGVVLMGHVKPTVAVVQRYDDTLEIVSV